MKRSILAFSALLTAVLLLALISAGCTETSETTPDLSNTGMVGTWQTTVNLPKYGNMTDIIYSFNSDGTGKAYYYLEWNNTAAAAVPLTWNIANSKLNTFDVVYPTIDSSETFTLAEDKNSIVDGYDLKYTKSNAKEDLIVGTWKSVNPYHRGNDTKYYDISYTMYADGTGIDAWYLDGNLTESDSTVWDFLCINDDGEYVYYLDYPEYLSSNIQEVFHLSPNGTVLEDRFNVVYMRE